MSLRFEILNQHTCPKNDVSYNSKDSHSIDDWMFGPTAIFKVACHISHNKIMIWSCLSVFFGFLYEDKTSIYGKELYRFFFKSSPFYLAICERGNLIEWENSKWYILFWMFLLYFLMNFLVCKIKERKFPKIFNHLFPTLFLYIFWITQTYHLFFQNGKCTYVSK